MIKYFIKGEPVAWQRTGGSGRMRFIRPKSKKWKREIYWQSVIHRPDNVPVGPVAIMMVFHVKRPKSLPKRVIHPKGKQDADNLGKAVLDALQGIFFHNDNQVVFDIPIKKYSDKQGVEIYVDDLPHDEKIKDKIIEFANMIDF